jgi:hypothetical protein
MDWRIKMNNGYRHFWLRDKHEIVDKHGAVQTIKRIVGCIATKRCQDGGFYFAYSAVNPKDNFDRELGRKIAYDRLELDRATRARLVPLNEPVVKVNVKQAILTNLAEFGPPVLRPAAELWLKEHVKDGEHYLKAATNPASYTD